MSTLDLTEVIEAAGYAFRAVPNKYGRMAFNLADFNESMAAAIERAAPLIARQVADSIAADFESRGRTHVAAAIAREWSPA